MSLKDLLILLALWVGVVLFYKWRKYSWRGALVMSGSFILIAIVICLPYALGLNASLSVLSFFGVYTLYKIWETIRSLKKDNTPVTFGKVWNQVDFPFTIFIFYLMTHLLGWSEQWWSLLLALGLAITTMVVMATVRYLSDKTNK